MLVLLVPGVLMGATASGAGTPVVAGQLPLTGVGN